MYPYIYILGTKVYMTGIGIIVGILVFIGFVYKYSKRYGLNFWKFFNWLPVFLILPYFFGTYFYFIINTGSFLPTSLNDLLFILSPYGYKISFIGMSFGVMISFYLFFRTVNIKLEVYKRLDVFFYAMSLAFIPLGLFLLLGDNFIGKQTDSFIGVSAFMEDSELYKYNKVFPLGMFISLVGVIAFFLTFVFHYVVKGYGIGFFGFAFMLLSLNIIFLFQQYSRHVVLSVFGVTFDIKNYWTIFLIILLFYYYYILSKEKGK